MIPLLKELVGSNRVVPRSEELCWTVLPSRARERAMQSWNTIEQQLRRRGDVAVPLACSAYWAHAWLTNYGTAVPHEFLLAERSGEPVGIALVTHGVGQKDGPFRIKTRHLGTAGERPGESVCVEYNSILVEPESRGAFEESLVSHILGDKGWESFCLDGFSHSDARRLLQDTPGATFTIRESLYHDLRATREAGGDVISRLGRSTRQNVRRQLRSMENIVVEWASTRGQAEAIFAELVELHQARWQAVGQPGAFSKSRFLTFQQTLIETAFANDLPTESLHSSGALSDSLGAGQLDVTTMQRRPIVLLRVQNQGQTIGCLMLLVDGNRLLDYLSGFASFEEKISPGVITHLMAMQAALPRNFDAYDFLVGEKRHKSNLSTDSHQLVWAKWSRPSLKNGMIDFFRNLKQRVREFRRPAVTTQSPPPSA